MSTNYEKRIRTANEELIDTGNLDAIDEFFTESYTVHAGGRDYRGHAFVRRFLSQLRSAIPDVSVVDVTIFSHSDETVAWQRTPQRYASC